MQTKIIVEKYAKCDDNIKCLLGDRLSLEVKEKVMKDFSAAFLRLNF